MLKIEFDASNLKLAAALGAALSQYGAGESLQVPAENKADKTLIEKVHDIVEKTGESKVTVKDADTGETVAEETVDTAAAFSGTNEQAAPANDGPVDEHGTPHNPQYCVSVKSQKPFYTSGTNKGQWKKKPGVDENAYNEWYAATMPLDEDEPTESAPVNTAAAFGGETKQTAPAAADAPKDSGGLMNYISERQAAGTLDQKLVTEAYAVVGVSINDLFDDSKEAEAVAKLYAHLQTVSL